MENHKTCTQNNPNLSKMQNYEKALCRAKRAAENLIMRSPEHMAENSMVYPDMPIKCSVARARYKFLCDTLAAELHTYGTMPIVTAADKCGLLVSLDEVGSMLSFRQNVISQLATAIVRTTNTPAAQQEICGEIVKKARLDNLVCAAKQIEQSNVTQALQYRWCIFGRFLLSILLNHPLVVSSGNSEEEPTTVTITSVDVAQRLNTATIRYSMDDGEYYEFSASFCTVHAPQFVTFNITLHDGARMQFAPAFVAAVYPLWVLIMCQMAGFAPNVAPLSSRVITRMIKHVVRSAPCVFEQC